MCNQSMQNLWKANINRDRILRIISDYMELLNILSFIYVCTKEKYKLII